MEIVFISYNYPPEANALALRTSEHARLWAEEGANVDVITDVPHFPEGTVYEGYRNRFSRQVVDGVRVLRVPQYIYQNRGLARRLLSFFTFMISAIWHSRHAHQRPDVVVASSPQFFTAIAGFAVSRLKRAPFVFEVRDIWPESAVAAGVVARSPLVKLLEWIEGFLYRKADHLVVVTDSFVDYLMRKGLPRGKISVIKNGVDFDKLRRSVDSDAVARIRRDHDLEGRFVVSYIGTIGDAHKADIMLEAARLCGDPDVVFMVVGTGPRRDKLDQLQAELQLPNVRLVDKQPHDRIFAFYSVSDVSVVHLRDTPLFRSVIPSKIFECMAVGIPIVLGVRGEAERIVTEAEAGIPVQPESAKEIVAAVLRLKADKEACRRMAESGQSYVRRHHDRRVLARSYLELLARLTERLTPASVQSSRTSSKA